MDLLKPRIALLAIVNPIGVIPFHIHFTEGFDAVQRRRTVCVAAMSDGLTKLFPVLARTR